MHLRAQQVHAHRHLVIGAERRMRFGGGAVEDRFRGVVVTECHEAFTDESR
jgi:hypothetical protein